MCNLLAVFSVINLSKNFLSSNIAQIQYVHVCTHMCSSHFIPIFLYSLFSLLSPNIISFSYLTMATIVQSKGTCLFDISPKLITQTASSQLLPLSPPSYTSTLSRAKTLTPEESVHQTSFNQCQQIITLRNRYLNLVQSVNINGAQMREWFMKWIQMYQMYFRSQTNAPVSVSSHPPPEFRVCCTIKGACEFCHQVRALSHIVRLPNMTTQHDQKTKSTHPAYRLMRIDDSCRFHIEHMYQLETILHQAYLNLKHAPVLRFDQCNIADIISTIGNYVAYNEQYSISTTQSHQSSVSPVHNSDVCMSD